MRESWQQRNGIRPYLVLVSKGSEKKKYILPLCEVSDLGDAMRWRDGGVLEFNGGIQQGEGEEYRLRYWILIWTLLTSMGLFCFILRAAHNQIVIFNSSRN